MDRKDVIAKNLPVLREIRGKMSQQELAECIDVSRRTIARLERGDIADPGVEQLARIADVLGVSVATIIEEPLQAVSIPLPKKGSARLEGKERAQLIERLGAIVRG